ncbi:hypothetical protein PTTG_27499 [Puccinia triticina 1-1 BBBD Race 1]|uniref:Uncharacterized protein n=1 Tax=Puccinia triticina (isolate 1-1 / race 1 (BBBD)) TaxID=630390 RepID=A0A180GJI2_PUCT1|nr:hypothetical protein PTTG_27499 [Puccinia triticina 1-1 BBBD Race 1]
MPSSPKIVHGIFAFGSLSAAISSVLISVRLGALEYIKQNYIDGLCVDVWDGFFRSPLNLLAITFLFYLPFHCLSIRAPASMLFFTGIMAIPSALFFVATFLELMPIVLPLGAVLHALALFGLNELRLARQPKPLRPSVSFSSPPSDQPKKKLQNPTCSGSPVTLPPNGPSP